MLSILISVNTVREDSVERIISPDIFAHTVKKKDHSSAHIVKKHLVRAKLWHVTRGHTQMIDHMCVMCARTHLSNGHIWRSINVPLVLLSTNVRHVVKHSWKLAICRTTNVSTRVSSPSKCSVCGKEFTKSGNLNRHSKTHESRYSPSIKFFCLKIKNSFKKHIFHSLNQGWMISIFK